ncbi:peptidylprolyl isomerase [Candidatus Pelagibacter sp.]|nr:peptidylprolyl isomerase [Candidatus Pelagibacter sp.]
MIKKILLKSVLILLIISSNAFSIENKILVKIENQIITSLDVKNEYRYLVALSPNLKKSNKEDIIKLSKRSIIREKIKKIEIEKNFNNPEVPQQYLNQILKNVYSKIGIINLEDFKKYLKKNNVNFQDVKDKLEIEALWNQLIFLKFSSKVKIEEEKLKKKIQDDNNKFLNSYLMSEISFEISNLNDLNNKYDEIIKTIKNEGFEFAALKYSLSPTSSLGGNLNWIAENSLNKNIIKSIKGLKINDITKPIVVPGGFLILQINDIRSNKIEVDVQNELTKLINFETNNQLNQYSKIYFNKVKKDLEVSEL